MVMSNDVLEHLHESPRNLFLDLIDGLKDGGLVFVTVPNLANIRKRISILRGRTNLPAYDLYYWYEGPWRGPVREYVRDDLEQFARYLGLEIQELTTVDHMMTNLPKQLHPVYRVVTRIFPDWKDTWSLVATRPAGWSRDSLDQRHFSEIYARKGKALHKR